jgi:hypothetical protein
VFLLILTFGGATAWWRAFSTMVPPDDEGTLIYSLRAFSGGRVLFDQMNSLYGPVWYAYECFPRDLFHVPIDHDTGRMYSVAFWTAGALALFLLIYRATESLAVAAAAAFAGFRVLGFIGNEPLHPQELCVLLFLLLVIASQSGRSAAMIAFGAIAAITSLTKVNLGCFVVLALAVVLTLAMPPVRWRRITRNVAVGGAFLFPPAFMFAQISKPWAIAYSLLVVLSLAAAVLATAANKFEPPSNRQLAFMGIAAGVTAIVIVVPFLMRGTTISAMLTGLLLWPAWFAKISYLPPDISPVALIWAAMAPVLAWLGVHGRLARGVIALLKVGMAVVVTAGILSHRWIIVVEVAGPMLWLVALPVVRARVDSGFQRPLLAVLGALVLLYAFPTAGSQLILAAVPILAAAAICAWDALQYFTSDMPQAVMRVMPTATVTIVLLLFARGAYQTRTYYNSLDSLALPGAEWLHQEPNRVRVLQELQASARSCSMLIGVPAFPSLSLFSGTPPPASLKGATYFNGWLAYSNDAEQQAAIQELAAQPNPCAISNPEIAAIWLRSAPDAPRPLMRYIVDNFQDEYVIDGYHFMTRKRELAR